MPMVAGVAISGFDLHANAINAGHIVGRVCAAATRGVDCPSPEAFDITCTPACLYGRAYRPRVCLGGHLAREQAAVALGTRMRRMPNLALDQSTQIEWYRNAGNRGPTTLPVTF